MPCWAWCCSCCLTACGEDSKPTESEKAPAEDGGRYTTLLPNSTDAVGVEHQAVADYWHALGLSLGDEHAVERVLVWAGKQTSADSVVGGDRPQLETFSFQIAHEIRG